MPLTARLTSNLADEINSARKEIIENFDPWL